MLSYSKRTIVAAIAVVSVALVTGVTARASVIAVGSGAFAGSPVLTFTGLADGTEVNGLTVNGVLFNYLIGSTPTNGQVVIDGGPGVTNNIAPPNVVSVGDNTGTLTLTLPVPVTAVGYGYAILATTSIANATTISLFSNSTLVGSLSYAGVADPTFTGGFAGIASTLAFNRVAITFNSAAAPAFAADNFVFSSVPEPSTVLLTAVGAIFLLYRVRRVSS